MWIGGQENLLTWISLQFTKYQPDIKTVANNIKQTVAYVLFKFFLYHVY